MNTRIRNLILLSIVAISAFMHAEHFHKDLISIHVWRQTQTQSTINNFYEEDMNILHPRRNDRGNSDGLFRMEFPLMQWLVAWLYKVFGQELIISRLFMFCVGLFSVLGMYRLLDVLFKKPILALMGAWAFNFSPSFYYYTINPMPDNLALCFGIWGLAFFFSWMEKEKSRSLLLSGVFLSLAALCKLPFILYFSLPLLYFVREYFQKPPNSNRFIPALGFFSFSLLPIGWYAMVIPEWQANPVLDGFSNDPESTRKLLGYIQHHLLVSLPESFLNYGSVLFFLTGIFLLIRRKAFRDFRVLLFLFLGLALVAFYFIEAQAIAKTHDYYLFPFYPLLFILVAVGAFHFYQKRSLVYQSISIGILLILPLTCFLRMQTRWNENSPGFNKDLLIYKEDLRNAVPKDALVVAGNDASHFIFFYYIDKKGWGFRYDELTASDLKGMIEGGATYLYTDSKELLQNEDIQSLLAEEVLERGSLRVFRLR